MKFILKLILTVTTPLLLVHCKDNNSGVPFENQHYYYSNTEGNNTIEGSHIYIDHKIGDTLFFDESCSKLIQNMQRSYVFRTQLYQMKI